MFDPMPGVEMSMRIVKPYKLVAREWHPVLKRETHLPVIVDPSHAGGKAWMVPALSLAAVAAGADGLLIEVHPSPKEAWGGADQALTPAEFHALMRQLQAVAKAVGRNV